MLYSDFFSLFDIGVSDFDEFSLTHLFCEHKNRTERYLCSILGMYYFLHNCYHVSSPLNFLGLYCVRHSLSKTSDVGVNKLPSHPVCYEDKSSS